MTVLWSDDFPRADGPLGLTAVGNKPWVLAGGASAAIVSGRLQFGAANSMALVNSGTSTGRLRATTVSGVAQGGGGGILFRCTSTYQFGYLWLPNNIGTSVLYRNIGSGWTAFRNQAAGHAIPSVADGDVIEVETSQDATHTTIVLRNITKATSYTVTFDDGYEFRDLTHWGLRGDSSSVKYDDVSFEATYSDVVLTDAPWGYWRLEDSTWADSSGNGRTGVTKRGTPTFGATGLLSAEPTSTSVNFGGNSGGQINYDASMNSASFTVECWFASTSGNQQMLMGRDALTSGTARHWNLIYEGQVMFRVWNATGSTFVTATAPGGYFIDGLPHHIVGVFDEPADAVRLYVDGGLVQTSTLASANTSGTQPITLGTSNHFSAFTYLVGRLDEAAYYTKALSAARIADHYVAGSVGSVAIYDATRDIQGQVYTNVQANNPDGFGQVYGNVQANNPDGFGQVYSNVPVPIKPAKADLKQVILRDAPRAYWEFEEASTATQFVDTVNGSILQERGDVAAAQSGYATDSLAISGFSAANYLDWPTQPTITTNFTVECMFRATVASINSGIFGTEGASDFGTNCYLRSDNGLELDVGNGTNWLGTMNVSAATLAGYGFALNTWQHLAMVVTSTKLEGYLNGTLIGTVTYAAGVPVFTNASHLLLVGGIGTISGYPSAYNGGRAGVTVDEFVVYDKALTAERIKVHADAELAVAENGSGSTGFTGWGRRL